MCLGNLQNAWYLATHGTVLDDMIMIRDTICITFSNDGDLVTNTNYGKNWWFIFFKLQMYAFNISYNNAFYQNKIMFALKKDCKAHMQSHIKCL